jgi:hypothetical protein
MWPVRPIQILPKYGREYVLGVLAKSPADFADSNNIIVTNSDNRRIHHVTQKGLYVEFLRLQHNNFFLAPLNCFDASGTEHRGPAAIYLSKSDRTDSTEPTQRISFQQPAYQLCTFERMYSLPPIILFD